MKITGVKKDSKDVIKEYKLDNGQVVDVARAVNMVKNNEIENCVIGRSKDGSEYIRSKKDESENNNLDNLPKF